MTLFWEKRIPFFVLLTFLFLSLHSSEVGYGQHDITINQAETESTSVLDHITSSFTGNDYDLEIVLPYDYDADSTKGFPVLYFPNYWDTNSASSTTTFYDRFLSYTNYTELYIETIIPSMITIGITRTGDDFTIDNFELDMIENSDLYHSFLQDELLPHINGEYNTDTSQTILMGWLEVGFFVVDSFFKYPNTPFTSFVSINGDLQPSIRLVENEVPYLIAQEVVFAERLGEGAEIDVDLYLGASKSDFDAYFPLREISRSLYRRGFEKLNLRTSEFDDLRFRNYGLPSINGLSEIYNPNVIVTYRIENDDIYINEEVQFTFTGSEGNRTDVTYNWEFGDGETSSQRSPSHVYKTDGGYKANLTVFDEYNQSYSYVYPATLVIKPGTRPIDLDAISYDFQNTEPYQTKENEINDVKFHQSWLLIFPILISIRKRKTRIVNTKN